MKITLKMIPDIYDHTQQFKSFKTIFDVLDTLNKILQQNIPSHFIHLCHVGAYDETTVVIYMHDQQLLHILKNHGELLLRDFNAAHYSFDKILFKVKPQNKSQRSMKKNITSNNSDDEIQI